MKFMGIQVCFTEWIRGHVASVRNNWGHNDVAQARSQKTRKRLFEKDATTWNAGLTKKTDERVAVYGQTQSANFTPERRAERCATMTRSWQTCAITPLTGSAHSQWAGGVSSLQSLCRSHLYSKWTYPKLVAAGFRCQTLGCASKGELHVLVRAVITAMIEDEIIARADSTKREALYGKIEDLIISFVYEG